MSKLKKGKVNVWFIDICCIILLLSLSGSVLADLVEGYIRDLNSELIVVYGNNTTLSEEERIHLNVFGDKEFHQWLGWYHIYRLQGCANEDCDFPYGTVIIAADAKENLEKVRLAVGEDERVRGITVIDDPDDIASLVGDVQDTADGIYSQTMSIDEHLNEQDEILQDILEAVSDDNTTDTPPRARTAIKR